MTKIRTIGGHKKSAFIAVILACLMMISLGSISAFAMGESKADPWPYDSRGVSNYSETVGNELNVYVIDYLNKTVYVTSSSFVPMHSYRTEPLYDDGNDIVHFQLLNGNNFYIKYLNHNLY